MEPYIGEIRIFAGSFAPVGWAMCNGALVPISQNETLYTLLGTTYGGDGVNTFALPDLRGRAIISQGRGLSGTTYTLGAMGGTESVSLVISNIPSHQHTLAVSGQQGTTTAAANNFLAAPVDPSATPQNIGFYALATPAPVIQPLLPGSLSPTGGSGAHENRMPFLTISYIICTEGIFPSFN